MNKAVITNRFRGDLWAIVSALTTGGGLTIAKIILKDVSPLTLNSYMFFFGSLIILGDATISRKLKETIIVSPSQLGFYFFISLIFCGSTFLFFTALSYSEPATISFLSRLELVATLIFAMVFLKEHVSFSELSGLIFVVAGIVVMRYGASIELSRAVLLITASSLLIGGAEVLTKSKIKWINPRSFIFYRGLFMVMIFVTVGTATHRFTWITDWRLIALCATAGFFLPYLGRLGYLRAMEYINISRASIIVQSQPFFAGGVALIILSTYPSLKELTGGLLIVIGVITIKLIEKRRSNMTVRTP